MGCAVSEEEADAEGEEDFGAMLGIFCPSIPPPSLPPSLPPIPPITSAFFSKGTRVWSPKKSEFLLCATTCDTLSVYSGNMICYHAVLLYSISPEPRTPKPETLDIIPGSLDQQVS